MPSFASKLKQCLTCCWTKELTYQQREVQRYMSNEDLTPKENANIRANLGHRNRLDSLESNGSTAQKMVTI